MYILFTFFFTFFLCAGAQLQHMWYNLGLFYLLDYGVRYESFQCETFLVLCVVACDSSPVCHPYVQLDG